MTASPPTTDELPSIDETSTINLRSTTRHVRRLTGHVMGDSLYRNSFLLLINMATTTVAGFGFWILCARLYSQADVGYATALVAALGLACSISNLGLHRTIVRFLGTAKDKPLEITTKLALICFVSFVTAVVMSMFLRTFGIKHASPITAAIFVLTVVLTSAKALFESVFIALRSAAGTLIGNTVSNVSKLVFPMLAVSAGMLGIFAANLVAAAAAVLCSLIMLRGRFGLNLRTMPSASIMRGKWTFMLGSYASDIIGGLPANVLPIIVVAKLGASQGALWYAVALMINFLLLISSTINQVMFAEISNTTGSILQPVKKALLTMYGLVAPATLVVIVFAPMLLRLFNRSYVEAAPVLRVMAAFALLGVINYVGGSIVALYKKIVFLTVANAVNAGVVIAYCFLFATNLEGILAGWIWGEIANLVLFLGGALYYVRRVDGARLMWAR
jgi:O-antigen/teichoic acid export membrane protein